MTTTKTAPRHPKPLSLGTAGARPNGSRWFAFAGLIILSVGFILPLLWMFATAIKPLPETMQFPPTFVTTQPHFENFKTVAVSDKNRAFDFALFARNTLIIATLTVFGTTLSSALVAYGFAKVKFRGRGFMFALMLSTMMIPFPVTMVSLFSIFRFLGETTGIQFMGTFKPLWVPAFFGSAFNIFLLRQFFITVPDELSEAARIDGCSEIGIFFRIILPLARPALSVVALFAFMGAWNDFLGPLVYVQRPEQYTLALGLQAFASQHGGTEWNLLMAASLLVIAPIVVLFFIVQKTFIEGIATTGIKG